MKADVYTFFRPFRKNLKYLLVVFLISTAFLPLVYNGSYDDPYRVVMVLFWSFMIFLTQFMGHAFIIKTLDEKISWVHKPVTRAIAGLLGLAIYASVAYILVNLIMNLIFFGRMPYNSLEGAISSSWFAVKISFFISFVITTIGFFQAWKKSEVEKERLNTQIMAHKYNALRDQINPHFLFNSLNVLSELVYEDQKLAVKFIRQLSDLYRYVLTVKNEDLVLLEREFEFAQNFSFLLMTRFEKGLEIKIDLEPRNDEFIIPMALQLLIENAIKHNETSQESPLSVEVKRLGNTVVVKNNLNPKQQIEDSTKKGLENLKERYSYLSDEKLEILESKEEFEVHLPILKVEQ
jgi:sensor histidine kinase YesM